MSHAKQRFLLRLFAVTLLFWVVIAYLILPLVWDVAERDFDVLQESPRVTQTEDHHPGDPLNVAIEGSMDQLKGIMTAAGWNVAVPLGLKSDVEIVVDSVLDRPDADAPVSRLFLFERQEDIAFEQTVANSPRHRHHVRFWKMPQTSDTNRDIWIGSAAYDERVGFSHTTGEITHVTAPAIDDERDYLFDCLAKTELLNERIEIPNFHTQRSGKNGGGDPWHTDGTLYIGTIDSEKIGER
ncbi:LssY C-terminal domain-containing protein [Stieleria varia]|uniref:LssY-like C-terminal domain-containing protein n=1 Tax=Stieleria varia TaxID=2528005 RepID=A0A5C6AS40_9BACT|nr:LssY C-terminal domain-containing protein [Stieleria varia]TWU02853.1 hypothetical protein Pla52n_39130 [Stieleria varia]